MASRKKVLLKVCLPLIGELSLWLADNRLGDHSWRQRGWKDKLDESIRTQCQGSSRKGFAALTRHMITGQ